MVFFNNIFNYESLTINRLSNFFLSSAATSLPIAFVALKTKKAPILRQKNGRSWNNPLPGSKTPVFLLRHHSHPAFGADGFASPDYPGFTLSKITHSNTPHGGGISTLRQIVFLLKNKQTIRKVLIDAAPSTGSVLP
jgi:hypothetical protein